MMQRVGRKWAWILVAVGAALVAGYSTLVWSMRTVQATVPTRIVINVVQRKLYLYRNHKLFHTYPVAVGKPETPSPRGEFVVTQKAIWGDGFGTRWIRFSAPWGIYGIHGTNKPWSVGTVASHGCFRMYNHDVEQVYALVSIGTPVIVEGITPYVKIRRPINPGQIGQDVVELQRLLRLARVYSGPLGGVYTPEVKRSVETFQTMVHLPVTGVATLETTAKLLEYTHQTGAKPGYLVRPS
ncbi:MAG: L,D-transpeptidase family protein [Sulfobacillus thermotolerans]|nr:L,D-transpeptidase family protein [Sulfobacillus thermotolerans]